MAAKKKKKEVTYKQNTKLNNQRAAQVVAQIEVLKIAKRLQDYAMLEIEYDDEGNPLPHIARKMMNREQIKAAEILFNKVVPNITKVETEHTEKTELSLNDETARKILALQQAAREKVIESTCETVGLNEPSKDRQPITVEVGLDENDS